MKRTLCLLGLLLGLTSVGCSRIASESVHTTRGATASATALKAITIDLADYDSFVVKSFSDGMGGMGNASFLAAVPGKVSDRIIEKTFLTRGGARTLCISGELIQYDEGSTTDVIVDPMQQALCRVTLSDESSGAILGVANLDSRAKSSFRKGPEELADGLGKGIADWIIKNDTRGPRPQEKD